MYWQADDHFLFDKTFLQQFVADAFPGAKDS